MRGDELMDGRDERLRAALMLEPPAELRLRLTALAYAAGAEQQAVPAQDVSSDGRLGRAKRLGWLADPAGWIAAIVLAAALWQGYGWLAASTLVLGDVVDAVGLLATLPALPSLGDFGLDPIALALWCIVAAIAWLVAEGWPGRQRETEARP